MLINFNYKFRLAPSSNKKVQSLGIYLTLHLITKMKKGEELKNKQSTNTDTNVVAIQLEKISPKLQPYRLKHTSNKCY